MAQLRSGGRDKFTLTSGLDNNSAAVTEFLLFAINTYTVQAVTLSAANAQREDEEQTLGSGSSYSGGGGAAASVLLGLGGEVAAVPTPVHLGSTPLHRQPSVGTQTRQLLGGLRTKRLEEVIFGSIGCFGGDNYHFIFYFIYASCVISPSFFCFAFW